MGKEFAVYKGEELLSIGTINEKAKELNVLPKTAKHYGYPGYKKKLSERKCRNAKILVKI